mmetsp:Transcript_73593/g.137523  ORF Transcript_73593/g.137523 Transcript_73593/m.137523 type:complete len:250 (-) Transcript_73593:874-1623(-)
MRRHTWWTVSRSGTATHTAFSSFRRLIGRTRSSHRNTSTKLLGQVRRLFIGGSVVGTWGSARMQQRQQLLTCPSSSGRLSWSLCGAGGWRRCRGRRGGRCYGAACSLSATSLLNVLRQHARRMGQTSLHLLLAGQALCALHLQLALQFLSLLLLPAQLLLVHLLHLKKFPLQLLTLVLLLLQLHDVVWRQSVCALSRSLVNAMPAVAILLHRRRALSLRCGLLWPILAFFFKVCYVLMVLIGIACRLMC